MELTRNDLHTDDAKKITTCQNPSVNSANMSQSRWKGQFCKQNKLPKSASFVSKFKAKHAVEEQSQCLEESQIVLKAKLLKDLDLLT